MRLLPCALTVVLLTACGTVGQAADVAAPATSTAPAGEVAGASPAQDNGGCPEAGKVILSNWINDTLTVQNPSPACTLRFEVEVVGRGGAKCTTRAGDEWFGKAPGPVFRTVAPAATQSFPSKELFPEWGSYCDESPYREYAAKDPRLILGYTIVRSASYKPASG